MLSRNIILVLLALLVAGLALVGPVSAEMAVLYNGEVTLIQDATFDKVAYQLTGATYQVQYDTPLGALQATGLGYDVTDKNVGTSGSLLLDGSA